MTNQDLHVDLRNLNPSTPVTLRAQSLSFDASTGVRTAHISVACSHDITTTFTLRLKLLVPSESADSIKQEMRGEKNQP